jgi:hypothetical protein
MDKELLESVMKLRGISIEVTPITYTDDDFYRDAWTFVIEGIPPLYSVSQIHRSESLAREHAEHIVQSIIQGE